MSNGTPWQEAFGTVFEGFNTFQEAIESNVFAMRLGKVMQQDIVDRFTQLDEDNQNGFIEDMWQLTHQAEIGDRQELTALYVRIAKRCEKFFEWEEDDSPGWVF
jgi:hypothetical protein